MSRKPEPHPFTRSYLQNLLIKGIGQDDMPHWQAFFSRDIAETVLPGVISSREARPLQDQNARSFLISRVVGEFGQNVIPVQYVYFISPLIIYILLRFLGICGLFSNTLPKPLPGSSLIAPSH